MNRIERKNNVGRELDKISEKIMTLEPPELKFLEIYQLEQEKKEMLERLNQIKNVIKYKKLELKLERKYDSL